MSADIHELSVLNFVDAGDFATSLAKLLNDGGLYRIHECAEVEDALSIIRKSDIDVVLIDDDLPQIDGLDVLMEIRRGSNSPKPEVIVFLLADSPLQGRIVEAVNSGAHEIMLKRSLSEKLLPQIIKNVSRPRKFIRTDDFIGPERRTRKSRQVIAQRRRAEDK